VNQTTTARSARPRLARRVGSIFLVLSALCTSVVTALEPGVRDPNVILAAVTASQVPARSIVRMKFTARDSTGTRERVMSMRAKRYPDSYKALIFVEAPEDRRNTGFLFVSYTDSTRSDEQWVYLPRLHRVTRVADIASSDVFMGLDFTVADLALSTLNKDKNDFEMNSIDVTGKVGDEDCWVFEVVPRTPAGRKELGYDRLHVWISKPKTAVLQYKAWSTDGKRTKYFKASDLRRVDGIWVPQRATMRTLEDTKLISETQLEYLSVDNQASVTDGDFTQQRLTQGL
jgi:hypothetical protein